MQQLSFDFMARPTLEMMCNIGPGRLTLLGALLGWIEYCSARDVFAAPNDHERYDTRDASYLDKVCAVYRYEREPFQLAFSFRGWAEEIRICQIIWPNIEDMHTYLRWDNYQPGSDSR